MSKQEIAIKVFELWLLLPVLGVPVALWFKKKGTPHFLVSLGIWLILVPVVLTFSYLGLPQFSFLMAIACVFACLELVKLAPIKNHRNLHLTIALALSFPWLFMAYHMKGHFPWPFALAGVMVPVAAGLLPRFQNRPIPVWTLSLSLGCSLAIWVVLQSVENGFYYVLWVFSVVVINDILSAVWGKLIKSPRLFPALSPNKSLAGYIGGSACAVWAGFIIWFVLPDFTATQVLIAALLVSVAGSAGDLFASRIKRQNGVKDFGTVLLTMGGILDRLDSLLSAGWAFFLYLKFVVSL